MKPRVFISVIAGAMFLYSCRSIMTKAYGIKDIKYLSNEEIQKSSAGLEIPSDQSFELDKYYFTAISGRDSVRNLNGKCSPMISKYMQPLQLMYFNEKGELISFHNNCYAGGFPKLKWNSDGQFNQFIPTTTIPITDTALRLNILLPHIKPLNGNLLLTSDTTVILFWSEFMHKQSKNLIRTAKKNLDLDKSGRHKIIYVNTDNFFVDLDNAVQINQK